MTGRKTPERPGVLVLNFGGPQGPGELEPFLRNLFEDVLPGPAWLKPFLASRVARSRAPRVLPNYEMIGWSPLVPTTHAQVDGLREALGPEAPPIATGMLFTAPTVREALQSLLADGVDALVAIALFPQFSLSTTSAAFDRAASELRALGRADLPVHWVPAFYDHPRYIEALGRTIRAGAAALPGDGPIDLLFSPHGLPLSFVRRQDPYPEQVRESVRRVVDWLGWTDPWHLGWQSRVGPVKWLTPSTTDEIDRLAREGAQRVLVVPISFVGEHIETLHEIDVEMAEHAKHAGIAHFGRAPALGLEPAFVACLAEVVRAGLAQFERYSCVRCLLPKPEAHRSRVSCPNCGFRTPAFLRVSRSVGK